MTEHQKEFENPEAVAKMFERASRQLQPAPDDQAGADDRCRAKEEIPDEEGKTDAS